MLVGADVKKLRYNQKMADVHDLYPCPDCGKAMALRSIKCPNCGWVGLKTGPGTQPPADLPKDKKLFMPTADDVMAAQAKIRFGRGEESGDISSAIPMWIMAASLAIIAACQMYSCSKIQDIRAQARDSFDRLKREQSKTQGF